MTMHLVLLFAAAIMAGATNAVAGGGTFISFPALMALGVPPLVSNATNAVCVTPGHALAAVVYRRELARAPRRVVMNTIAASAGAVGGAWLLTVTNAATFTSLVPWLLLAATLTFAFGPAVQTWTKSLASAKHARAAVGTNAVGNDPKSWLAYALASIYGGYFGAGQGIVLMTVVTLTGVEDVQEANAIKNAVATCASLVAVIVLSMRGLILWNYGLLMVGGALIGGLAGGALAKILSKNVLRRVILCVAVVLTAVYFWRTYAA
jgi:hypothetical protein